LGFLLLNSAEQDVILPIRRMPTVSLHGADAVVLGCAAEAHISARLVLVIDTGEVFQGGPVDAPCP
jgi:Asp/Glu/hydantoin racemase